MTSMNFLFSIANTSDGSAVFITSKDTWENEGAISQGFNDQELQVLEPILEKAGLNELMESCYEMTKSYAETKDSLIEEGLMEDKNFDNLINTLYS